MTDNVKECREKFQSVLAGMTPRQIVSDDTFLEKIHTYLTSSDYNEFLKESQTIAWIEKIVESFDSSELPTQQVANFTLKILSLLCSNEWQFAAIKEKNLLEKIQIGIEKHPELQKPAIKHAHIQLLNSLSQHSIGLHWLKQTRSWKLSIDYYKKSNTIFIIREAGNFLYTVISKFCELMKDESLCMEIIEEILAPLIDFRGKDSGTQMIVDDDSLFAVMTPCMNIANHLLIMCIESQKRSRMAYYILLKYRYENKLWLVLDLTANNDEFKNLIMKSMHIGNFARLSCMDILPSDDKAKDLSFDVHTIHFYNLVMACMEHRAFKCVNIITEMHHQLWYKLGDKAPKEIVLENHDLKYGDQVVMIQSLPIIFIIKSRYKANEGYLNELCTKMFNISCEHTIRILYQYRDGLKDESYNFIADLAANAVQKIASLKKFLTRERASLAFQILIYVLRGYVDDENNCDNVKRTCNTQLVLQAPNLLSALLIGLNDMIKYYNFAWNECIESTAIVPLLLVLLDNPNLNARQTVESLKLIQTSIEHFLAPNLALLMDKMEGSGMEDLGPTMYKRLHDNSWEVRDSVLELLHSMVELSHEKFPPFQKHIMENKICQTVEIVARNDSESYVRASAFKVLASMIKIRLFWDHALHEMDVKKYALQVLGGESEGVVRREAVACIVAIYKHQQIPPHCLDTLFSVMAHCSINDLHWEVKVNALCFWSTVICRQFTHQGMIDGTFPAVTFSKEHRKIITLTDKEIQIRLLKVLNELSLRGCLGVMIAGLQDSDLEVIKKIIEVVDKIMVRLNKYKFMEVYKKSKNGVPGKATPKAVYDIHSSEHDQSLLRGTEAVTRNNADINKTTEISIATSRDNGEPYICSKSDIVIDSIINSDDISLLSSKYKANLLEEDCNTSELGQIDEDLFKKYATVTADDFLSFIETTDLNLLVEQKSEWLQHSENFSNLLDDVLRSFGNDMDLDCY